MRYIKAYEQLEVDKELIRAFWNNDSDKIKRLLNEPNIDVNYYDKKLKTSALLWSHDNIENMKLLLNRPEIDVNVKNERNETILFIASTQDRLDIVKELLKRSDVDVNVQDNMFFRTPLIVSAQFKKFEVVKELLKRPDIDLNIKDEDGKDFFDYLNKKEKSVIKKEFPEQYEKYLMNKKVSKYNL